MTSATYNTSFSEAVNYGGFQAGYIAGNVQSHHHYSVSVERPEKQPLPCLSIPFPRDRDFIERQTIMGQLNQNCARQGSRTALVGLGGIGKSQLAIEYVYRVHDKDQSMWIFWIHASNTARFEQGFREIAETVKLFGRKDPKANIFRLVHDWLQDEKNGKWTLVLDNVDDASFLTNPPPINQGRGISEKDKVDRPLRYYLPYTRGSILITSRSKEAALSLVGHHNMIKVEPMDKFIPLAIVQAAAYISDPDRGCTIQDYLKEFGKNDRKKVRLLGREEGQFRRDWDAKSSILFTLQISFDSIRDSRRTATDLLSLMSFFDYQGIPRALLQDYGGRDPDDTQNKDDKDSDSQYSMTDEFNDDILMLRRYSLISSNEDQSFFNMHSLVQLAIRRWLEVNGNLEKYKRQFIYNLSADFPSNANPESWGKCQMLFPHAKSAVEQQPEDQQTSIEWASVLYRAARYKWKIEKGAEVENLSVRAMETLQRYLGLENTHTLDSMCLVALIYDIQVRYKEAEELHKLVLEKRTKILGAAHIDTLFSKEYLAFAYSDQGRYNEAEELIKSIFEERKKTLGVEHPMTLDSMSSLAIMNWNLGRYDEIEGLLELVLDGRKKIFGERHVSTLTAMSNLAIHYSFVRKYEKAENLQGFVTRERRKHLHDKHTDVQKDMLILADIYEGQEKWKEAEKMKLEAIETMKKNLGAEHPDTLIQKAKMESLYTAQSRYKEAEELLAPHIKIMKRILGDEHPAVLFFTQRLADIWKGAGRHRKALDTMIQCKKLCVEVLGADHPYTKSAASSVTDWKTEHLKIKKSAGQ